MPKSTLARYRLLPASFALLLLVACGDGGSESTDPISRGAKIFARSGCATCHGEGGRGDGPAAHALTTKPRDFTQAAAFRTERTPAALARLIAEGGGNGAMPPYPFLSDAEREQMALYVLSLAEAKP